MRYYLDPERHSERKYIGIVFEKEGKLPTPKNAPTRRKLNRVSVPIMPVIQEGQPDLVATTGDNGMIVGDVARVDAGAGKQLRPGYMWREANWQIGRAGDRAGITAIPHQRKDRWLAWRKRQARAQRAAEMKSLKKQKKAPKKAKR